MYDTRNAANVSRNNVGWIYSSRLENSRDNGPCLLRRQGNLTPFRGYPKTTRYACGYLLTCMLRILHIADAMLAADISRFNVGIRLIQDRYDLRLGKSCLTDTSLFLSLCQSTITYVRVSVAYPVCSRYPPLMHDDWPESCVACATSLECP